MPYDHLLERSPMKAVATTTRGGLQPGQVGACLAHSGIGKTAFIVQLAIYQLLRGTNVLHVSRSDSPAHVRAYYDELFGALATGSRREDRTEAAVALERHRVIHSSLDRVFEPKDLRKLCATLSEVMDFRPSMVVIDGLEADVFEAHVDEWKALARELKARLWLTIRTHRDSDEDIERIAAMAETAVLLVASGPHVDLRVLRRSGGLAEDPVALALDPVTMLLRPEDVRDIATAPPSPAAEACTLFTGGAVGAEAWFGECAENWGVAERNFSFDGHEQARTANRVVLDEAELAKGGVSLVYVANRLHRSWKHRPALRKVLQVLWHVVSNADQVFVVGAIQPDGTVHGGTGWSVELARRWNKRVWVFDQPHEAWFTWQGTGWVQGVPVIESANFAGTGTRFLTEAGRAAVADLFQRSFGEQG